MNDALCLQTQILSWSKDKHHLLGEQLLVSLHSHLFTDGKEIGLCQSVLIITIHRYRILERLATQSTISNQQVATRRDRQRNKEAANGALDVKIEHKNRAAIHQKNRASGKMLTVSSSKTQT
jgi:hypothetical protein